MIVVDAWLQSQRDDARMIMQVHDELVFEVRDDRIAQIESGVRERMAAAAALAVPLVVDVGVGNNWDEAH
jgi:DNA polymerase-1